MPILNFEVTIPRHIHFIWIGSPIPQKYIDNVERFVLNNHQCGFNFTLWVDHDTKPIDKVEVRNVGTIKLQNQSLYDREVNYGAKADILRYEIINQEGGIYNDIDAISLIPFDRHWFSHCFFSHTFWPWNNLTNAVFGLPAGHPLLKLIINRLPASNDPSIPKRTGPDFFTKCFLDFIGRNDRAWEKVCKEYDRYFISQDLLVYPRHTINIKRQVGYTFHLNDANWTTKPMKKAPKLSLCTAIKNRLCHLSQTLPQNIADAGENVEFVVVDYTSDDGLSDWIKPFVSNGLVNYFRAEGQQFWKNSHAKNVAALASTGDIICNVDADNYITNGFTQYIIDFYKSNNGVSTAPPATPGVTGRIAMKRQDFLDIGGYNELYDLGWGCEDIDLVARARGCGLPVSIIDLRYLRQIAHSNKMRGEYSKVKEIWVSNEKSLAIMNRTLEANQFIANADGPWGCCDLIKNYHEVCSTKSAN